MFRTLRPLICAPVVLIFALMLISSAGAEPAGADANKIELTVWMNHTHTGPEWDVHWERIREQFEEKNPGFTVTQVIDGFSFDPQAWVPRVAAGVAPDAGLIRGHFAYEMYTTGILKDLTPYIERTPHMALENFIPASTVFGTRDGTTFGIPWTFEARIIAYDTRHVTEAGLNADPRALATWDDLIRYAERLTVRHGDGTVSRAGIREIPLTSWGRFLEALFSNGAFYLTEDGMPRFATPEAVEALEFLADLRQRDVMMRGATVQAGTASMGSHDTSALYRPFNAADPNFPEWLQIAPYPKGPSTDDPKTFSWSNLWAIPVNAKYPDQSWSFIEIWMSLENQIGLFEARGGTNPTSPLLAFYQTSEFHQALSHLPFMAQLPEVFLNSVPRLYIHSSEIINVLREQLSMFAQGTISAASTLEEVDRRLMPVFLGGSGGN